MAYIDLFLVSSHGAMFRHPITREDKQPSKKRETPGPKPETLRIDGDWQDAVRKSLGKKKPVDGWPK